MSKRLIVLSVMIMSLSLIVFQGCVVSNPYITGAKIAMDNQDYELAKKEIAKALDKNPKIAEAYFLLGNIAIEDHEYAIMRENFDKSVNVSEDFKGKIASKISEVFGYLYKNGALAFNDAVENLNKNKLNIANAKFKEATQFFVQALSVNPNPEGANKKIKKILADSYVQLKKASEAKNMYMEALVYFPKDIGIIKNIASLLVEEKKDDEAMKYFEMAIKLEPGDKNIIMRMAEYYERKENFEKALSMYNELLKLNPKDITILFNKSVLLRKTKKNDEALKVMEQVIEISPNDADALVILASYYNELGKFQAIVDLFNGKYDGLSEAYQKKCKGYLFDAFVKLDGNTTRAKKYYEE